MPTPFVPQDRRRNLGNAQLQVRWSPAERVSLPRAAPSRMVDSQDPGKTGPGMMLIVSLP